MGNSAMCGYFMQMIANAPINATQTTNRYKISLPIILVHQNRHTIINQNTSMNRQCVSCCLTVIIFFSFLTTDNKIEKRMSNRFPLLRTDDVSKEEQGRFLVKLREIEAMEHVYYRGLDSDMASQVPEKKKKKKRKNEGDIKYIQGDYALLFDDHRGHIITRRYVAPKHREFLCSI